MLKGTSINCLCPLRDLKRVAARREPQQNGYSILKAHKASAPRQLLDLVFLGNSSCITLLHAIHGVMSRSTAYIHVSVLRCPTYGRPALMLTPLTYDRHGRRKCKKVVRNNLCHPCRRRSRCMLQVAPYRALRPVQTLRCAFSTGPCVLTAGMASKTRLDSERVVKPEGTSN